MFVERVRRFENQLKTIATAVRCLGMDAVLKAKSGHVGLPLGGADIGTFLYFVAMQHAPQDSQWLNRDRFVLSAGHGSMLQYALLHLAGYKVSLEDIKNFRQLNSKTPGHPEYGHTEGIECTTGPLGQGIANAVGLALAERMLAARLNTDGHAPVDHMTYVLLGDGCLMEGISSEACSLAGHLKLEKLVAFYDANNITIDGTIDISFTENVGKRFEAFGWRVLHADAHNFVGLGETLDTALTDNKKSPRPTIVICKGIAGKGSPKWEGKNKIHGNPMSAEDVVDAKKNLGLANTEPFLSIMLLMQQHKRVFLILPSRNTLSGTKTRKSWPQPCKKQTHQLSLHGRLTQKTKSMLMLQMHFGHRSAPRWPPALPAVKRSLHLPKPTQFLSAEVPTSPAATTQRSRIHLSFRRVNTADATFTLACVNMRWQPSATALLCTADSVPIAQLLRFSRTTCVHQSALQHS